MVFICETCYNPNDPDYIHKYTKPIRYHMWLRHLASADHQGKLQEKWGHSRSLERYTFLNEASYVIAGIPSYVTRSDTFMYEVAVWASGFGVITEFAYFQKEECFLVTLQGAGLGPYGPTIERAESIAKERRFKNFSIRVFRKHLMTNDDWYSITRGTLGEVLRTETRESGYNQKSGTQQKTTMQRMPRDSKPKTSVDNKENFNNHSVTSTSTNDVVDAHGNKNHGREKSNKHRKNAKESKTLTTNATTTQEPQQSQQVDAGVPNEVKFHRGKYDGQGHRNGRGRGRTSRVVIPPSANRNQPDYVVIGKSVSAKEPGDSSVQGTKEKEPKDKIEPFAENQSQIRDALEREKEKIEMVEVESCEATTTPNHHKLSTESPADESTPLAKGKIEPAAEIPSEQRVATGSEETVAISELRGCEATTDPATLPQNPPFLDVSANADSTSVAMNEFDSGPGNPSQQRDAIVSKDEKVSTSELKGCEATTTDPATLAQNLFEVSAEAHVGESTSTAKGIIEPTASEETVAISELKGCESTTDPTTLFQKLFKVSAKESTSVLAKNHPIEPAAEIPSKQCVASGSEETVAISELKGCEATTDPATLPQNQLNVSAKDPAKESTSVVAKNHPIEPAAQNPSQQRDAKETKERKVVAVKRSEDASHLVTPAANLYLKVSVDPVAENTSVTTTKETREVVDVQTLCEANLDTEVPVKEEERVIEEPDYMQYALYWYRF